MSCVTPNIIPIRDASIGLRLSGVPIVVTLRLLLPEKSKVDKVPVEFIHVAIEILIVGFFRAGFFLSIVTSSPG